MRSSLSDIVEELLKIALIFKYVFVKVGHFGHADNLAALLEEDRNANVFRERKQSVEIA